MNQMQNEQLNNNTKLILDTVTPYLKKLPTNIGTRIQKIDSIFEGSTVKTESNYIKILLSLIYDSLELKNLFEEDELFFNNGKSQYHSNFDLFTQQVGSNLLNTSAKVKYTENLYFLSSSMYRIYKDFIKVVQESNPNLRATIGDVLKKLKGISIEDTKYLDELALVCGFINILENDNGQLQFTLEDKVALLNEFARTEDFSDSALRKDNTYVEDVLDTYFSKLTSTLGNSYKTKIDAEILNDFKSNCLNNKESLYIKHQTYLEDVKLTFYIDYNNEIGVRIFPSKFGLGKFNELFEPFLEKTNPKYLMGLKSNLEDLKMKEKEEQLLKDLTAVENYRGSSKKEPEPTLPEMNDVLEPESKIEEVSESDKRDLNTYVKTKEADSEYTTPLETSNLTDTVQNTKYSAVKPSDVEPINPTYQKWLTDENSEITTDSSNKIKKSKLGRIKDNMVKKIKHTTLKTANTLFGRFNGDSKDNLKKDKAPDYFVPYKGVESSRRITPDQQERMARLLMAVNYFKKNGVFDRKNLKSVYVHTEFKQFDTALPYFYYRFGDDLIYINVDKVLKVSLKDKSNVELLNIKECTGIIQYVDSVCHIINNYSTDRKERDILNTLIRTSFILKRGLNKNNLDEKIRNF